MSPTAPRRSLRPRLWAGTCTGRAGHRLAWRSRLFVLLIGFAAVPQEVGQRRPQSGGRYRLVEQMVTAEIRLAETLRGGVPADEESRDGSAQRGAQELNDFEAGPPIRQLVVGND